TLSKNSILDTDSNGRYVFHYPPPEQTLFKGSSHVKTLTATLLLLALSLPLWAANPPDKHRKHDHDPPAVGVAEGGGPIAYMLVSGAAVVGLLVLRKRNLSRRAQ